MRVFPLLLLAALAAPARAQVTRQIPDQSAGATDWWGERAVRVNGRRVDVEPKVEGYAAVLRMAPDGGLNVVQVLAVTPARVRLDIPQDPSIVTTGETVRVPFVVTTTTTSDVPITPARRLPPPSSVPPSSRVPVNRPPSALYDGLVVILSDVPLDSAQLVERLAVLPALAADSVADGIGRVLLGRRTAMWAVYFRQR